MGNLCCLNQWFSGELEFGVPYEITGSCYRDKEPACGTCDACAFRNAGSQDPISHAERPEFS